MPIKYNKDYLPTYCECASIECVPGVSVILVSVSVLVVSMYQWLV